MMIVELANEVYEICITLEVMSSLTKCKWQLQLFVYMSHEG